MSNLNIDLTKPADPSAHTITYTKGKGHVSGEPMLIASCTCGREQSSYLSAGELAVRAKLSKALADLHQIVPATLGRSPTPGVPVEDGMEDSTESSTLGG